MIPCKISEFKSAEDIQKAARICIKNRLYVNGWTFQRLFKETKDIEYIAISTVDSKPVGCLVKFKGMMCANVGVYVRPKYRRQQIGSRLLQFTKDASLEATCGLPGSDRFYKKNKIKYNGY